MTSKRLTVISVLAFFGLSVAACGQQAKTPTLEEILQRMEANLNHYDKSLPSVFCDEHVVSRVEPGSSDRDTVTDSTFRLKRAESADHTTTLVESREIKKVDGKVPTPRDKKRFPSMLSGAFEGGFAVVSLDQMVCMRYRLERVHGNRLEPYVIDFATALTSQNSADCLLQEKSKGRVFVDPASMEIVHLEMTTPRHVIIPGDLVQSPVIGKRVVTVDYAPVVLDRDTFWMPSAISSRDTSGWTTWSFEATYGNYHRLEVKSRILPGEAVAQ